MFDSEDKYALFIGIRTDSGGARGVFLAIELFNNNENIESYVKKCEVRYSPEGISFVQPNGYLTFVPKSVYE
ncbi:hypothetical protein KDM89_12420 [Undibacterium sp. LFS511W]|uniref:Uncharacterized protein n=1 Tax=Undibacterium luofuense TaxID=2828733 RepID=A0A941I5M9_9BURK|nr:hypothetical protein [Undibacterium luofuense]